MPWQNQGFYFDDLTSTVTSNTNGTGNNSANVINGNSGHNILLGTWRQRHDHRWRGDDTLDGGADTDTVNGGDGNDTITVQCRRQRHRRWRLGHRYGQCRRHAPPTRPFMPIFAGAALTSLGGNVQNVEAISLNMARQHDRRADTLDYTGSTEEHRRQSRRSDRPRIHFDRGRRKCDRRKLLPTRSSEMAPTTSSTAAAAATSSMAAVAATRSCSMATSPTTRSPRAAAPTSSRSGPTPTSSAMSRSSRSAASPSTSHSA